MTLAPKQQYEKMVKELESLKSTVIPLDKAEKSETPSDDIFKNKHRFAESAPKKKIDSKKTHFYVEKTFDQLFTAGQKNEKESLDQPAIQSSSKQLHTSKHSTERGIPAKSIIKHKLVHGLPGATSFKLDRQHLTSKRASNDVGNNLRRKKEKVRTISMKLKRQVQTPKRAKNGAERNLMRAKPTTWVNYLV